MKKISSFIYVFALMTISASAFAHQYDLTGHVRIVVHGTTPIEMEYNTRTKDLDSCTNLKNAIIQTPIEVYGSSDAYKKMGTNTLHTEIKDELLQLTTDPAHPALLFQEQSIGGAVNALKIVHLSCTPAKSSLVAGN